MISTFRAFASGVRELKSGDIGFWLVAEKALHTATWVYDKFKFGLELAL